MSTTTTKENQLTQFATYVYEKQKEDFVLDLARRIKKALMWVWFKLKMVN
jgi:hypothetical protein